jgi:TetR/AcrR family acrAB operon transcriptional repressor
MTQNEDRRQRILDAAAELIIRHGYDKTTVGDIAEEAGIGRGLVYLLFKNKDDIFEALIRREVLEYSLAWLEHIEADPRGGTIGGIYRAVLYAIKSRPFMAAIMRRDRQIVGRYLRKPDNLFASMQSSSLNVELLRALQEVGAVRQDIDPVVTAHILDMLSYGMITIGDFKNPNELPPYDVLMEVMADMVDRLLTPEDGGNVKGGKAVIRQIAAQSRAYFERMQNRIEA